MLTMENSLNPLGNHTNEGASTSAGNTVTNTSTVVHNNESKIENQNFPNAHHVEINAGASTSTANTVIHKSMDIYKNKIGIQKICVDDAVINISNPVQIHAGNVNMPHILQETKKAVEYYKEDVEESFRGRDVELAQLKSHLLPDESNKSNSRMTVISGLPGIGKTELARKFVSTYENDFNDNILWISAESKDYLKEEFKNIFTLLEIKNVRENDIKTIVTKVYSYFEKHSCLFVFDNAETMRDINAYLPSKSKYSTVKYSILITSRNAEWGKNISLVKLNELPMDSAVEVAKAIIGEENCESNNLPLNEIVDFVDRIPLGIQIISYLIRDEIEIQPEFSFAEFFTTLEAEKLVDENFPDTSRNHYDKTIFVAIKLAIEKIEKIENCSESGAREALDVLHTVAYLSPDHIYTELLSSIISQDKGLRFLNKALAILCKFGLIRRQTEKIVRIRRQTEKIGLMRIQTEKIVRIRIQTNKLIMHRLVQKTICLYQERENIQGKYINATLHLLFDPLTAWNFTWIHRHYILKHQKCIQLFIDFYMSTKSHLFLDTLVNGGNKEILSEIINKLPKKEKNKLLSHPDLLEWAIYCKGASMVEFLFKNGLCVQQTDSHILRVIAMEKWDAAKALIRNRCDFNAKNECDRYFLFEAIGCNSPLPILKLLLEKGADVLDKIKNEETLLHILCEIPRSSTLELIKYLCENTELIKYINEKDSNGFTPLHRLFTKDNFSDWNKKDRVIEISEYLIQMGADPCLKTNEDETLLHLAVKWKSLKLVEYLITYFTKLNQIPDIINEKNGEGQTALHKMLIVYQDSDSEPNPHSISCIEECAKYLIDNNSDLNVVDKRDQTILQAATKLYYPKLVKYILEKENNINVNKQDVDGYTILHNLLKICPKYVVKENDCQELIEFIFYLKYRSFDFNLKTTKKLTLLHFAAAATGNLRLLQTIHEVTNNYDINTQDSYGHTILHISLKSYQFKHMMENDSQKLIEYILFLKKHSFDFSLKTGENETLLHFAASTGNLKLLQTMHEVTDNDCYINAQNFEGYTMLHILLKPESMLMEYDLAELLMYILYLKEISFDFNLKTKKNETLVHFAASRGNLKLLQTIHEVTDYYDINTQDSMGSSALHWLFKYDYYYKQFQSCLKYLINHGANINLKNANNQTILHVCIDESNYKLNGKFFERTEVILSDEMNFDQINCQDIEGDTALHQVGMSRYDLFSTKSAKILLENGANLNIQNDKNETALDIAAKQKKYNLIKAITQHPNFKLNEIKNNIEQILFNVLYYSKSLSEEDLELQLEVVKDFIKMGANINAINENKENLLHLAAGNLNYELIKFICEHKQYTNDINVQDNEGNTVLHHLFVNIIRLVEEARKIPDFILQHIQKSIEYLINSNKSDITIKNNLQQTVLHLGAISKNLNIVKFIVESWKKSPTFNINQQDEDGNTVLHYLFKSQIYLSGYENIFQKEYFAVVYYLLLKQANPAIFNQENETPSQLALINRYKRISRYLDEYVEKKKLIPGNALEGAVQKTL